MKALKFNNKYLKLDIKIIKEEFPYTISLNIFTSSGTLVIPSNCVKFDYLFFLCCYFIY